MIKKILLLCLFSISAIAMDNSNSANITPEEQAQLTQLYAALAKYEDCKSQEHKKLLDASTEQEAEAIADTIASLNTVIDEIESQITDIEFDGFLVPDTEVEINQ